MNTLVRLSLAFAAGVVVSTASAAERTPLSSGADVQRATAAATRPQLSHVRMAQPATQASATAATPKAMGSETYPGTPMANAFRAYPPSCAADPLPNRASGPTSSKRVPLYTTDGDPSHSFAPEVVTVTLWRLACSSSGSTPAYNPTGAYNAITLMRIDRDAQYEGDTTVWPTFPSVEIAQGSIGFGGADSLARAPTEPNTVIADTPFDSPIYYSTTYVLENNPYQDSGYFTFSDAFKLRLDPYSSAGPSDLSIGAYDPKPNSYPDAFAPLPLDGYAAAQWISGTEGLLVQVSEQYDGSGHMTRQLVFDLLTQDLNGDPLWLVGNAAFPIGATSLNLDTIYLGPGLSHEPWGKVNVQMPSCGALDVTFTPNARLPAPIPSFSGLTTYGRLFDANGMVCE